jgi:Ca-activated chloride channel family protein
VGAVAASLAAPDSIAAGGALEVRWTDFISIDAVGAPERDYGPYAYPSKGNPLRLRAPDDAGEYVLRYHTGQTYKVLATRPLRVDPVTASLRMVGGDSVELPPGTYRVRVVGTADRQGEVRIEPGAARDLAL